MGLLAIRNTVWARNIGSIALLSVLSTLMFGGEMGSYEQRAYFVTTTFMISALLLGHGVITKTINRHISWTLQPVRRLTVGVVAIVVYTLFVVVVVMELLELYLNWELSAKNYYTSVFITIALTVLISLMVHARSFLHNWRQTAIERERLEKAHVVSQYQTLRNQVNPHFLFNSLDSLIELVHQDADEAERFVQQLSRVYRYVLEKRDLEVVSLQEELGFLKRFFSLHALRQPNTLQVQWPEQVPEAAALPPLALQLLAENIISHNVLDVDRPLNIILTVENAYLLVENTLQPTLQPQNGSGAGLSSLISRYKYLTDRPVVVEQTEAYFRVCLPLLELPPL